MSPAITQFSGQYRWLSNFYPCFVRYHDVVYPTTEHAYQATKTLDDDLRLRISRLPRPGLAKTFYRDHDLISAIRPGWHDLSLSVMEQILRLKFIDTRRFRDLLLATGDVTIQEGNYWGDTFWGVDLRTASGLNHLGKIIMRLRKELQEECHGIG